MDEDAEAMLNETERQPSLVWREPVNGNAAFFTEEVYTQLAGPEPTLEEKVMKMMDALGFPPPQKGNWSRNSIHTDTEQRKWENSSFVGTSSQGDPLANSATAGQVQDSSAASSSQQETGGEDDKKTLDQSRDNSHFVAASAPTSPDTPVSPPSQSGLEPEPQTFTSEPIPAPLVKTTDHVLTSVASSSLMTDSETENKLSGGHTEGSKCSTDGVIQQSLSENNAKRDNSFVDGVGQTRYSARRTKMHDKGRRPPVPEPRKSSLTHEQHVRYLHLFKKCTQRFFSGFCQPPTSSELKELQEFESLQMQVAKEQEECQAHLKQTAEASSSYLYTSLPAHVSAYTQEKEQSNWKRAETYCRYYNTDSRLPLVLEAPVPPPAAPALPAMILRQTVLELGSKCKVVLPDLNPNPNARFRRTVCTELPKVSSRFPSQYPNNPRTWNHEPASKDSNLEDLVRKYPCHVATSASVLQQLIDNHGPDFPVAWDIPVVIKQYGNGAASQKVVFLDKPLLPRVASLCEKKTHYLKKAVRAYLCQPHNERKSVGAKGRGPREPTEEETAEPGLRYGRAMSMKTEDDDPFGSVSMDDLETFGSDKLFSDKKRRVVDLKYDAGKQSDVQLLGRCTGEVPGSQVPGAVSKTNVQDEPSASKDCRSSKSKSDITETTGGNSVESKQDSEEKNSTRTEGRLTDSAQVTGGKPCPKSSVKWEPDPFSDSDNDALVIADVCSPSSLSGSPTKLPQHGMRRRSQSFRGSIFDEVPSSTPQSPDSSPQQGDPVSRRITRSVSLKLLSPDGKSSVPGAGVTSTLPSDSEVDSMAASEASTSPRTTRNSLKRRLSESRPAASGPEGSGEESVCAEKKGRKAADHTDSPVAAKVCPAAAGGVEERAGRGGDADAARTESAVEERALSREKPGGGDTAPSYLDSLLNEMTPVGSSTKLKLQEDPSQYRQPGCPGEQVSYHQWDLEGVAIIVRCNGHAFFRDIRQQQKAVYVCAKPERQIPHGLEQNTRSECVRGWLGCYLRPNSYLLKARVNMQNYEVVQTEELQLNQILQPTLNFSPQCAFAVLKNILTKLTELSAGSYLLTHEAGASHIQLKSGTASKRGSYDLRAHYMGLVMQEADSSVPWVPVDPTLLLPYHWHKGLIPATFQPPDFDSNRKKQQFAAPKKKHRKKQT